MPTQHKCPRCDLVLKHEETVVPAKHLDTMTYESGVSGKARRAPGETRYFHEACWPWPDWAAVGMPGSLGSFLEAVG